VVGAALHSAEVVVGLPVMFGGLGLLFGNVQLYFFVEIARDVHEMAKRRKSEMLRWPGGERQHNMVKDVKNRMKITKQGEAEQ
jgi:hypothetical protein